MSAILGTGVHDFHAMKENILAGLVAIVALGAAAQWLAWRLRIPSILILLLCGFAAGPVAGLLDPDALLGDLMFPLVSLGAAVVLFEGGLTASWREIRGVLGPVHRLVTIGIMVTWCLVTVLAYWLLGLGIQMSLLLGALLVVTGPTVVGPLLRYLRPSGSSGSILKLEGILNDPVGAVLAVLVFQIIETGIMHKAIATIALGVLKTIVLSSIVGALAAFAFTFARRRELLPQSLQNAVCLPLSLVAYVTANQIQHESGLLAVTIMGIVLASQSRVDVEDIVEFTDHARTMLISALFILLSARMTLDDLRGLPFGLLWFIVALIFLVRPATVLLSTIGTSLSWKERTFLSFMAPRGIVAAAVASVFSMRLVQAGHQEASVLMPITFCVITVCVAVYGLGGLPLVRVLGLRAVEPRGFLILGANRLARELAQVLQENDHPVTVIDADRRHIRAAREQGLRAIHGRALTQRVLNRIDMAEIGGFIGLVPDDEANTLVAAHFRRLMNNENIYQLSTDVQTADGTHLRGGEFAWGIPYEELSDRMARGARIKATPLTEEYTYEDFLENNREAEAVPLLALRPDEAPLVLQEGDHPETGCRIVSLVGGPTAGGSMRGRDLSPALDRSSLDGHSRLFS